MAYFFGPPCTRWAIISGPPGFYHHNSGTNICYFYAKICVVILKIMLHESHRKFTIHVLPLPCKSCIITTSLFTCLIWWVFTKEDKVLIKFPRETKRYRAKRFLSGVPYKDVKFHKILLLIMKVIQKRFRGSANYGPPCRVVSKLLFSKVTALLLALHSWPRSIVYTICHIRTAYTCWLIGSTLEQTLRFSDSVT